MARPIMASTGPSLAGAIHAADASPTHLLERLRKLVPEGTEWTSPPLTALRASLNPSSGNSAEQVQEKPTQSDIMKLLGDSDPNKRAEGLAAAGYHQFVDLYEKVLEVAAHGSGVERNAAIYGLGFYGRDVPDGVLSQLMTADDLDIRLSGLELATRRNPARFARESMDIVRSVVKQSQLDQPPVTGQRSYMDSLPRLLSRQGRGPIPDPLLDGRRSRTAGATDRD